MSYVIKLQLPKEDWKNWGPPPPISYKSEPTLGKTLTDKSNSLKVNIKTQPRYRYRDTVVINVPLFRTGITEALINIITILNKIIQGQGLTTGPQKFGMTRNLVIAEPLRVFE